jgi:hypothetical protein
MNRIKDYITGHFLAFQIGLAYVGLGTLSVCSVYPADFFYGDRSTYGLLITFPVCFFSFGFRFAEGSEPLYPVFIIQFIMFVLSFLVLSRLIKKKRKAE